MIQISLLRSIQTLIYLFPFSFIFGNFVINTFVLIITLIGILLYRGKMFIWQDKTLIFFIIFFFFLILISSYFNYFFIKENKDAIKSFLFLRYLFFLLIVRTVIVNRDLNLKNYLIFLFLIVNFISADILIQFFFGKNLIGFNPIRLDALSIYYTGFLREELVAGGYILMFATLSFFSIPLIFKNQKKTVLFSLMIFFALIFLCALVLAGNRMPTLLFMFFLLFAGLIYKNKKNFFLPFTILLSLVIFIFIFLKSEVIYKKFENFYIGIPNPITVFKEVNKIYPELEKYKNSGVLFLENQEFKDKTKTIAQKIKEYNILPFYTGHNVIFITSIDLFMEKPFLGGGIKSFRNNCKNKLYLPNRVCENHPHNFFLDILNDLGLIGLVVLLIPVYKILVSNYKSYKHSLLEKEKISNWVIFSLILAILIHFFPIKSSGSFFSTFNSAYTFFILGISIGLHEIKIKQLNR